MVTAVFSLLKLPVVAVGDDSRTRLCKGVSVTVVALAEALAVVPVLGVLVILRFERVRWLL
jgi:hypothetical protein